MLDRLICALNKINHNLMVFFLFMLGVCTAFIGFLLIAAFPHVDHDIMKGLAALGALIIGSAMTAFRSSSDSSKGEAGASSTKPVASDPPPSV